MAFLKRLLERMQEEKCEQRKLGGGGTDEMSQYVKKGHWQPASPSLAASGNHTVLLCCLDYNY